MPGVSRGTSCAVGSIQMGSTSERSGSLADPAGTWPDCARVSTGQPQWSRASSAASTSPRPSEMPTARPSGSREALDDDDEDWSGIDKLVDDLDALDI